MVKITDGKEILIVTNGAFKSQYKPFGWKPVEEAVAKEVVETVMVGDDEPPVIEKPLSEMTGKELKAKAKELGIDISSATSKGEVRKMLADVIK